MLLATEFTSAEINEAVAQWERLQFADPLFVAPDDVPKSDWWAITHAASDASNTATKQVVALANEILEAVPKGRLTEAIEDGDVSAAMALFDWQGYTSALETGLADVFGEIGIRSGADTAIEIGKGIDYDESNFLREAARGARIVAARITKSTRRATSDSLRRLMSSGTMSPRQVGLQIFAMLGLDPVQAASSVNKTIAQREAGASLKKVREATAEFAENAREVRAERIARFENLNVAQTAQEDAVKQHVDVRALKNVVKIWVVVPDDSLCPICNRLRNQRQVEGDSFTDPDTGLTYIGPPAHQSCRCGLRYLEARPSRATGVFVVDIRVPDDDGPVTVAREELRARIFHAQHDQKTHGKKKGIVAKTPEQKVSERIAAGGYDGISPAIQTELAAKEMEISQLKHREHGFAVHAGTGKVVVDKKGDKASVDLRDDLANMDDTIFTHNHPSGNGFSRDDIVVGFNAEVEEMRAVTSDGTIYRAKYPSPPQFESLDQKKKWLTNKRDIYDDVQGRQRRNWRARIEKGEMTVKEANSTHHHKVMVKAAPLLGIKYERVGPG